MTIFKTARNPYARRKRERVVEVGFSSQEKFEIPLKRHAPLICGRSYYFWLEIGKPVVSPTERASRSAALKVVLFGLGDLAVEKGAAIGELMLPPEGIAAVVRQPTQLENIDGNSNLLKRRLFFPLRAPRKVGDYRFRCNIYCDQLLLQSRLIRARVAHIQRASRDAHCSKVDYTLTGTMDPAHLTRLGPHHLSLMLNQSGPGTVDLRFFGEKEFTNSASFDTHQLQNLINLAREGLRIAAWGDKGPWEEGKTFKYNGTVSFNQLRTDLVMLAKRGYDLYSNIIDRFTGGPDQSDQLAALMRVPGRLQIALKESARHLIPAALLYDHTLDTGLNNEDLGICSSFKSMLGGTVPLEDTDCFKGSCPSHGNARVVCPSGFWGFRHNIGMPLSLDGADAPFEINWKGFRHLTLAVSTELTLLKAHQEALNGLQSGLSWDYAETRDETLRLMRQASPHLVYFYCHGGLDGTQPYIKVGPSKGPRITQSLLRAEGIRWHDPRPLVFINGCNTTALEPEQAFEFVSGFVTLANASGVIGTDITVFEPLAKPFAENFLRSFVVAGKSCGESMRSARLALLKAGNPLGLVYLPFVIGTLRMVERAAA